MYGRTTRLVGTSLVALFSLACNRPADTASRDSTATGSAAGTLSVPTVAEVRATIEAANQRSATAMKAGDISAMSANYADDARSIMPGMPAMNGRAAIEEAMKGWLAASTVTDAEFTITDVLLADDVAIETGTYRIGITSKDAKATASSDAGKYLAVWQRQSDGGWRIVRDMSTPDVAPTPPSK